MRLLWAKAGRILPVDTGGKIRSYNLARQLAARHDLTFVSYYDGAEDSRYEHELRKAFPGAMALSTGAPTGGARQGIHFAARWLEPAPYAVSKFYFAPLRAQIVQWDREARFDVMICDFLSASLNFPEGLSTRTVLFQHNVESALWARQAQHEPHALKRFVFRREAGKMSAYEPAAVRRFDHVIAVSPHDKSLMESMTTPDRLTVVRTGVDLTTFRAAQGATPNDSLVLFLGSMDWEANADGVSWFCDAIWPKVKAVVPQATFRVVGRNPGANIRALATDSIAIAGGVPSVIPHLQAASVFVVPLRIGGGTRLKIFEAMATGCAVVSTAVGAEGLDVRAGTDILLEDDPTAFANAVVRLLQDPQQRAALGRAAAATAARFDWSNVVDDFESALHAALRAPRA